MKTVALCSAGNETYVLGLAVALASAISHAPKDALCRVYVLDGGIRDRSWEKLAASIASLPSPCELVRLQPDMASFAGLPQDWGSSVMTYARLALPEMITETQVLYVDADMVVQADWEELWDKGTDGAIIAAAPDVITRTMAGDRFDYEKFQIDPDAPYFQAGFLLMNLEKWRQFEVSQKVLTYLRENPNHCRYWDQSALNVVLYQRWRMLPPEWNTPAWWADQGKNGVTLQDPVLHFVGPHKPWIHGHHQSSSAALFFHWVDRTAWKKWRPSTVRQAAKWLKFRAWQIRHEAAAWLRGGAKRQVS